MTILEKGNFRIKTIYALNPDNIAETISTPISEGLAIEKVCDPYAVDMELKYKKYYTICFINYDKKAHYARIDSCLSILDVTDQEWGLFVEFCRAAISIVEAANYEK